MAAELKTIRNESGQSILEVVFVLPLLFLFVGMLYKMTMACQMAINNTQYARSQLYVLAANSPEYPRLSFRESSTIFSGNLQDAMILGVADPKALDTANANDSSIEPIPQTQVISRRSTTVRGSNDAGEVKLRNEIRVRNTVGICTQQNSTGDKKPWNSQAIVTSGILLKRWPFNMKVCQYQGKYASAKDGE